MCWWASFYFDGSLETVLKKVSTGLVASIKVETKYTLQKFASK